MKAVLVLLLIFTIAFSKVNNRKSEPIPGRYIFVFNESITLSQKNEFMQSFQKIPEHKVRAQWEIGSFHGFSAETSAAFVSSQLSSSIFQSIEQDATVHLLDECIVQSLATWGIDRVSERAIELDGEYEYEWTGANVDAYIIDTGVYVQHNEFSGGRAVWGATFTGDNRHEDCNGHGTHVAGTVGGTIYGIAKKVSLIAVKVLNCGGSGTWEGVISGINWVTQQYQAKKKPTTANMSLGGGFNQAVNNAVIASIKAGVVHVIAAGNNNGDACLTSPASTKEAITVGATDIGNNGGVTQDIRSSFSNWGTCVDMFAPGSMITSAWIGGNNAVRTISGTSMASPHVCGVTAVYMHENPTHNPAQVEAGIVAASTKDVINLQCRAGTQCNLSPNRMIFSACDV